ncbi:MAG: diguanylate cyclase [Lachnospiraceae bacterium]|nr:diguanylate cyclase [Lachnospiraceae bacterium]
MEVSAIKKNLLIIEKNEHICQELRSIVTDIYNIIEIADIGEVMPYLSKNKDTVSAVLFNSSNFYAEGKILLNEIKNDVRLSSIPILLIAEEQETSAEAELLMLGALDCIYKPFHREAVRKRIANAIHLKDSLSFHEVERMLKELPSNIYLKDSEGRYIFCTHYWHHLDKSDDPNWTIRGKTDIEIRKDKENAAAALEADMNVLTTGKGTAYTIEINEDGIQEFFEVIKQPLKNEQGKITGIIGLINHVTEYEQMKRKLEDIVRTDELTGLYSRYYFDEYLQDIQKKELYPISVISADCDGLKSINDTYGHLVGDEYIRMASLLFRMVLQENGAAFRTGGDEFIILLPSTSEETAQSYLEQMKEKEKLFQIRGEQLSVSLGLSSIKNNLESADECIAASDMNMYNEKRKKKEINRR